MCNDIKSDVLSRICRFNLTSPQQQPSINICTSYYSCMIDCSNCMHFVTKNIDVQARECVQLNWNDAKIYEYITFVRLCRKKCAHVCCWTFHVVTKSIHYSVA